MSAMATLDAELHGFLLSPEVAEYETLEPLPGVRWPAARVDGGERDGQVALTDVPEGSGELQEWGARGSQRFAIGKCPACRRGVSVTREVAADASWQVRSACCARWTVVRPVDVTVTTGRCDSRCDDATGPTCRCSCGGARHGITWRIK